jgi:D-galactarolactone cycloisomerase
VVEVYAGGGSLCWNPLPLLLRELEQLLEQGFRAVKIKIGHGPEEDAAIVRTLRQAAGPDVRLMVDANRAYDLPGALRLARVLEEEHIDWFEEPFPYDDPECWRTLRRRTHVPLAGGEGFSRIGHAAEAMREGMLQVLQCDAGGFGLEALLAIGSLAAESGVALTPHCCNSGIGFVVGCHLQTALPNRALQEYETFDSPFVHGLFTERPAVIDGKVTLPETPGLGITLNEDVIDRYLVR